MHAIKGAFKVFLEGVEGDVDGVLAGDQNVVQPRAGRRGGDCGHGGSQAAPDAVALDCAAHGLGHGEAEARGRCSGVRFDARLRFQNEKGRRASRPAPNSQEFRSLLQGGKLHNPTHAHEVRDSGRGATTPTGACGPWHDDGPEPLRRQPFPYACGTHAGACAQACSVDTCASRYSPSRLCIRQLRSSEDRAERIWLQFQRAAGKMPWSWRFRAQLWSFPAGMEDATL